MKKNREILRSVTLCFAFIVLTACGVFQPGSEKGDATVTPTTVSSPLATRTPTATETATRTPTLTQTFTPLPSPSATNRPTSTMRPTSPPKPTATPLQSVELPAWVSEPGVNVLLVATGKNGDDLRRLFLVNASSLEFYELPQFNSIRAYFWAPDGRQMGILTKSNKMILVDIFTGNVKMFPAGNRSLQFLQVDGHTAFLSSGEPAEYILYPAAWQLQQKISYDGHYAFEQEYGVGISIVNLDTGEKKPVTGETDGSYAYAAGWSPVAPYLAIVQSNIPAQQLFWFEEIPTITLKIYDIEADLVNRYSGVTFPKWAPDGTMFLYQPVNEESHLFWDSAPCVYHILTDETRCYNDVLIRHGAKFYASFAWVPGQTAISYLYYDLRSDPYQETGGLCFIALPDGRERCILEALATPDLVVTDYHLSPDGGAAAVILGHGGPVGDEISSNQFAVVNVDTEEYVTIENVNIFHSGFDYMGVWRPKISPNR